MARICLRYVHSFIDHNGHPRHYFRRPGFKRVTLPGLSGSPEFMAAYQAALTGQTAPRHDIGASRTKPGTVNAAVIGFYNSPAFRIAPTSQAVYRGVLENFRSQHGEKGIASLERRHIELILNEKASRPAAQKYLLRMIERHLCEQESY